jgi:hypothetical protein
VTSPEKAQRGAVARAFRPRRTLLATVVSILLAAAALVTVVGAVTAMARGRADVPELTWLAPLGRARWDDTAALATAAVACVLGLALLATALAPGRRRVIALASEDPQTVTAITRAGLGRHLATVASGVDGVSRARARLRGKHVRVTVMTPLRDTAELPGEVTRAVFGRLEELRPLDPLLVDVAVRKRED